jgi:hypothetical protein
MAEYSATGSVQPGQAQVIAISRAVLPTAIGEGPVPRLLQGILGVGNLVLEVSQRTGEIVGHSVEHRDEVQKKGGAAINTAPFLDHAYSHKRSHIQCVVLGESPSGARSGFHSYSR